MCTAQILSSVGLGLDIAGALILWFFPIPLLVKKGGIYSLTTSDHESLQKHVVLARLGIGLILFGFTFQFAANLV